MKFFSAAAALALLLTLMPRLSAQVADARSLAAETAFAHESVARGMRTAFLDALSDEGIVFQPGPQNGIKAWPAEKSRAMSRIEAGQRVPLKLCSVEHIAFRF